jgi:hypothetical protein
VFRSSPMLGPPKPRRLDQPIAVSLEQIVPSDHFYRHLEATLDLSFVRGWVKELYAEAKEWYGLRRLRLRGLLNASIEGLLIASGQNLMRFLATTGWGRRHAPCGSLLAIAGEPWTVSIGS